MLSVPGCCLFFETGDHKDDCFLYLCAAASTNLRSDVYVTLMRIAMANGDSKIVLDLPKTAWNLHLMGWNLKLFMASNV